MPSTLYRPDLDEVRLRLRAFWETADIGRPALLVTCPRTVPLEPVPTRAAPPGWITDYATWDYEYRVHLSRVGADARVYFGEALPNVAPDLAPNCLALYLGCEGVDMPGTVWCKPFVDRPEDITFRYDPDNPYWRFTLRLGAEQVRIGRGKWTVQFPDLIEGLDTLEAMRGAERLLLDLVDRPDWVQACLRRITDMYFRYYDVLYDLFRDETGGSVYWTWAPGRVVKLQCDFSAMMGPQMFRDFMVPVLAEMTERVSYSLYHWDGPGAIRHHDHLLGLPRLGMIQWTPGAGHPPPEDECWWPLFHKTIEAGKRIYLAGVTPEGLEKMRREFGARLRWFMLGMEVESPRAAERVLALAERSVARA